MTKDDNNNNENLTMEAASEDDNKTATAKKEENNTAAAASDNSASSSSEKNTAQKVEAGTAGESNAETNQAESSKQEENNNSLEQERQNSIQKVEKAWKDARLSSSENEVLGKDWKKEFENDKDKNAIDKRRQNLLEKIIEEAGKEASKKEPQSSSTAENNSSSQSSSQGNNTSPNSSPNENPTPASSSQSNQQSENNEKSTNEQDPQPENWSSKNSDGKEWTPEFKKEVEKIDSSQVNSIEEAKKVQNALTVVEKVLNSQNFQPDLVTKLHAIKDGEPDTYRTVKTQMDQAIQHSKNLSQQSLEETANEQIVSTNQEESENRRGNNFTTGQKVAIGFGIVGGVAILGLIINRTIEAKKKREKSL